MSDTALEYLCRQDAPDTVQDALPLTLSPGRSHGPHCHSSVELCLVRRGGCDVVVNGETTALHAGEIMVIFSHTVHSFRVPEGDGVDLYQLHLRPDVFLELSGEHAQSLAFVRCMADDRSACLLEADTPSLFSCAQRICAEMADGGQPLRSQLLNTYVAEMIFLLSREMEQSHRQIFAIDHPWAVRAIRYINDHMDSRISSADVARSCSVTPRYLSKVFRQAVNISVNDYISIAKVDRAMRYLCDTDLTMTAIASKLDFCNTQYFSTVFKKYTGMTPRECRRYHAGN